MRSRLLLVAGLALMLPVVAWSADGAGARLGSSRLYAWADGGVDHNAYLSMGEHLYSPSGHYELTVRSDGNLVSYSVACGERLGCEAFGTGGGQRPGRFFMQLADDGQMQVYPGAAPEPAGGDIFRTDAARPKGHYYLSLGNDGLPRIYSADLAGKTTAQVWPAEAGNAGSAGRAAPDPDGFPDGAGWTPAPAAP